MEDIGNELKSFFTRHRTYLSVRAACKLDLFEAIGDEHQNAAQIAGSLNCQPGPVLHLLRAMSYIWAGHVKPDRGCVLVKDPNQYH